MLRFENVDFSYPGQKIFENLNLKILPGDFSFIIGKSGIGKSTLFQLVYMNLLPEKGSVKVGEYYSTTIEQNQLPDLRKKLGVVFQDFKLLEDRNVFQNVSFVLEVLGVKTKEIKKRVLNALTEVGLSNKIKNMPSELSGGEKQRVAIARAIVNEPMLILADEPTGNLDSETSDEIIQIFNRINSRGTTILIATHNYDIVKKTDAKIYKLKDKKAVKVIIKSK